MLDRMFGEIYTEHEQGWSNTFGKFYSHRFVVGAITVDWCNPDNWTFGFKRFKKVSKIMQDNETKGSR